MNMSIAFRIVFFILLGLMLIARMYFNVKLRAQGERVMPDKQAIQHEGMGMFAFRFIGFFVLIAILVLYAIRHPWMAALDFDFPAWLRWVGAAIGLMSIALMVWVELALGRQFSPQLHLRQQHQMVTSGPYTHVRHPLYTALDGFGLSLALVSANWFFVGFFILSLVGLWVRVPREERMLLDKFGEQYREYMQSTGRFFPKM